MGKRKTHEWPSRKTIVTVVGAVAATVAFLAALPAAVDAVRGGAEWAGRLASPEPPPTEQQQVVGEFAGEVQRTMSWLQAPTIYEPSLATMRGRLSEFDPRVPHGGDPPRPDIASPIGDLVDRSPQTAGLVIETWGKISHRTQVKVLGSDSASWAIQLREPGIPEAHVVCRIPLGEGQEAAFRIGEWAAVTGIAVADGGVPRADGPGTFRVLYVACSHAVPIKRPVKAAR